METEAGEATFEGLMETGHQVVAGEDQFDASTITHAMITPDGTTVPITLNPETGQFMTPDGQAVQVQVASDDAEFMHEESETVLPDEEVMDQGEEADQEVAAVSAAASSSFQVLAHPQAQQSIPVQLDQGSGSGNIQVLSSDGSMVRKC